VLEVGGKIECSDKKVRAIYFVHGFDSVRKGQAQKEKFAQKLVLDTYEKMMTNL
jgi:hypothetical protein